MSKRQKAFGKKQKSCPANGHVAGSLDLPF